MIQLNERYCLVTSCRYQKVHVHASRKSAYKSSASLGRSLSRFPSHAVFRSIFVPPEWDVSPIIIIIIIYFIQLILMLTFDLISIYDFGSYFSFFFF